MNIKKFGKRLTKINMLFDSIKEDGEISAIEKDLLLSYMREAYEYVQEHADDSPNASSSNKRYADPAYHVPPQQATSKPSVMQQIASEEIAPVAQPRPAAATPDQIPPAPQPSESAAVEVEKPTIQVDPKLEEIFQNAEVSELSDRLSMSSIKDMNRAMGINERIFTVTELFGGDNAIFNSVLNAINDCKSYDEAKEYLLTGIAKDQDWSHADKIKKAEHFAKLVKRRFV